MLKKLYKYGSSIVLLIILVILIVPSWRISFQGWFQGLWMDDLEFTISESKPVSSAVDGWNLSKIDGTTNRFSSFNDAPIILSFWATWCPSCRAELGELKSLQEHFNGKINFIAVSEESAATIKESNLNMKYDFLYTTDNFPHEFQIRVYPTLLIINNNLIIHKVEGAGAIDTDKNRAFLNGLIKNR